MIPYYSSAAHAAEKKGVTLDDFRRRLGFSGAPGLPVSRRSLKPALLKGSYIAASVGLHDEIGRALNLCANARIWFPAFFNLRGASETERSGIGGEGERGM